MPHKKNIPVSLSLSCSLSSLALFLLPYHRTANIVTKGECPGMTKVTKRKISRDVTKCNCYMMYYVMYCNVKIT
jgi:hypothetical protein